MEIRKHLLARVASHDGLEMLLPLCLSRFILSAGNFVFPFLTLFLTRSLGYDEQKAGGLVALVSLGGIVGALVGGVLADRVGRLWTILVATLGAGCAYLSLPFATSPAVTLVLLVAGFFSLSGVEPAFQALVAESVPDSKRREAYSYCYLASNLGFAVAPAAAGFLFERNLSLLFMGDALFTLAAGLLLVVTLGRRQPALWRAPAVAPGEAAPVVRTSGSASDSLMARVREALRGNISFVVFLMIFSLWPLAYSQVFFLLPLHATTLTEGAGTSLYGWAMALNGLLVVVLSPILLRLTKRFDPFQMVVVGGLFYALGFGGYALTTGPIGFFLLVPVWTMGEILTNTNVRLFVAERTAPENRGRFSSLLDCSIEAGYLGGPALMGFSLTRMSSGRAGWILVLLVGFIGALSMLVLESLARKRQTGHNEFRKTLATHVAT
jgi:MFS family permease